MLSFLYGKSVDRVDFYSNRPENNKKKLISEI